MAQVVEREELTTDSISSCLSLTSSYNELTVQYQRGLDDHRDRWREIIRQECSNTGCGIFIVGKRFLRDSFLNRIYLWLFEIDSSLFKAISEK
jgi:hypothetical protein